LDFKQDGNRKRNRRKAITIISSISSLASGARAMVLECNDVTKYGSNYGVPYLSISF
jgi:hypothetical protein